MVSSLYIKLSGNVTIEKSPMPDLPKFTRHPLGQVLNDGDPAAIECEVRGQYTTSVILFSSSYVSFIRKSKKKVSIA